MQRPSSPKNARCMYFKHAHARRVPLQCRLVAELAVSADQAQAERSLCRGRGAGNPTAQNIVLIRIEIECHFCGGCVKGRGEGEGCD